MTVPTPEPPRDYPVAQLRAIFDKALGPSRRPKLLSTRVRHAIDAIADVLDSDQIEASDRVMLESARAALETYAYGTSDDRD